MRTYWSWEKKKESFPYQIPKEKKKEETSIIFFFFGIFFAKL